MMREKRSIAIDGPSGAGKSSLARRCAEKFGFVYADTGAIYRCVGLAVLRAGADARDEAAVKSLLETIRIGLHYDEQGQQRMSLNGEDVSEEIRLPEVSRLASDVSALPAVRRFLLQMQRSLAEENDIIMDGRDIGTVVLPDADLKIYLTASAEQRAVRRLKELKEKGLEENFDSVLKAILYRDEQDMNRAEAPLRKADDAVELDTSELDFEESFAALSQIILERLYLEPKA